MSLSKYKRSNVGVLEDKKVDARKNKKQIYTEKITINLTQEEANILNKIHEDTGIPKSTLIRRKLREVGLFK